MEYWDILDENRVKTGRLVRRGDVMSSGEFHLVVHVWLRNQDGEYLISRRATNKTFPGMWETTGGSAVSGDDSCKTALKETFEELGVILDQDSGILLYSMMRPKADYSDFCDVWLFDIDNVDISTLTLQESEVAEAMWASKDLIREMIQKGEFLSTFTYIDELFKKY